MSEVTKEEIQQMREAALTYPYDYAIGDMFPRRVIGLCDLALSALDRKWRPIETAPKDGTRILVWCATNPSEGISLAYWSKPSKLPQDWAAEWNHSMPPTHYMLVPEPPKENP